GGPPASRRATRATILPGSSPGIGCPGPLVTMTLAGSPPSARATSDTSPPDRGAVAHAFHLSTIRPCIPDRGCWAPRLPGRRGGPHRDDRSPLEAARLPSSEAAG